jgi:hypothetical protein
MCHNVFIEIKFFHERDEKKKKIKGSISCVFLLDVLMRIYLDPDLNKHLNCKRLENFLGSFLYLQTERKKKKHA